MDMDHPYEIVNRLLRLDKDRWLLFWLDRPLEFSPSVRINNMWNTRFSGKEALFYISPSGYRCGNLLHKRASAHRIIWTLFYGEIPSGQIDHIDGIRTNNNIENLRCVSPLDNSRNAAMRKDNSSGISGVHKVYNGWQVRICYDGVRRSCGVYPTLEDAKSVRDFEMSKLGYRPNHRKRQSRDARI